MNYQVLARKWRPQVFSDVVGQEHVLTTLEKSLSSGRIHHAYLFSGTRGVGKTSIARLLVKGLNCKIGITATPCDACDNCLEIKQGRFLDLIEIDAALQTKVEDTRDLLENVQYSPARGRFKSYLIDEVHMLSRYSFNALLKTLEEPPVHVKFFLATTDPQKLPATILSRCLQFHLKALDVKQISIKLENILNTENIAYEAHALQLLARAADGSMRDALNLTDQAIASGKGKLSTKIVSAMLGILSDDQALSLIEAIVEANGELALSLINTVAALGIDWETLLIEMLSLLHRLAMLQLSESAMSTDMTPIEHRLRELARTVPPAEIQLYYQILLIGRKELPFAPDRRTGIEMTILRALAFHPKGSFPKSKTSYQSLNQKMSVSLTTPMQKQETMQSILSSKFEIPIPAATSSVLAARIQLQQKQRVMKSKKNQSAKVSKARSISNSTLERISLVKASIQSCLKSFEIKQTKSVKDKNSSRDDTFITNNKKIELLKTIIYKY